MRSPAERYLRELAEIYATGAGVKELSYYGPLARLIDEVGRNLKPRVRCIMSLANQGAGMPDGGLFTAEQFERLGDAEPRGGQRPARGVIEAKSPTEEVSKTILSAQVQQYWRQYRQVLVTNFREFVLIAEDADGKPAPVEHFALAPSATELWQAARHATATANAIGERFLGFLERAIRRRARIADPHDVAWFLASYARDAKGLLEAATPGSLAIVRKALEESLGIHFEGKKGEHFFRSSLVQTLFYGVFSAWVLWAKAHPPADKSARFDWRTSAELLNVPVLRRLYYEMAEPGQLQELGLARLLSLAGDMLNGVDRAAFFDAFKQSEAVQYFYEPFLRDFDPELRKDLGVWYTPTEIVTYMVARVDRVLREELKIAAGLADQNVMILDPCCGTGAFLVQVLRVIAGTLRAQGGDALIASDLRRAAIERVFGLEILPAPFVIAHLQLGAFLQEWGAPLDAKKKERAGVFLTNALTGWETPRGAKKQLAWEEFTREREAADDVKRERPILVILGNPPYNAFAGVSPREEDGLVSPYKVGLQDEWGIRKFNLDDLYVRFFRLAERRIAEKTGRGVIALISSYSYLGDASFVVMRRRFLGEFDAMWFDCLNGDSRETGKLTPDGKPDPSIFSTEQNREGIRVGTAIGLLVRRLDGSAREGERRAQHVRFRQYWGVLLQGASRARGPARAARLVQRQLHGPPRVSHRA